MSKSFTCFPCQESNLGAPTAETAGRPRQFSNNKSELLLFVQLDVDTQRADFLDEYVEGLRHAGLHTMVTINDVFIHLGTTRYVIRLYLFGLILAAGFAMLLWRLWVVQIEEHKKYLAQLPQAALMIQRTAGIRGEIKDRNGIPLATNRVSYEIKLDLREIERLYKSRHQDVPKRTYLVNDKFGTRRHREESDIFAMYAAEVAPQLERLNLLVAAVVTGVLENGNLLISGSQEVRVNHELRILNVAGIVRPQDVNADNEISYDRIAEARISYGGRGRLTEVQQPPIGQQVVDIYSPF